MTHLVLLLCCCVGSVCAFFSDLVKFENVTAHAGARVNLTCSIPSNESVSRIELGRGYTPGDGQLPLAVATSNNGTHITNGGYNYSLTLEWVNDSNTSVSLIIPNVTLAHAGYYTCNVTLINCSVASGVHCNYSAGEEDDQYHANRTLTQRMHLTVIPATTIAPTTLVSHTTSTSHRPHRRPVSKRPTHKPVTLGPFPIDPWRPKTTWVHWALLLITCAVVAPVLLIIIISCLGWLAGWGRRRKGWIPL
uniref:BILF2 n=1 Tax=Epstein-Barr virus (strain GD1) TaxID=10376 RepID=A0A2S1N146_EBVG|nr:BILF2 [human gammaherpesvirus 4]AWG93359.1 BILF2 [human gammaherpesvirus 4]